MRKRRTAGGDRLVAIATSFLEQDNAYSLVNVAQMQLAMLLNAGYEPRLVVGHSFQPRTWPWTDERVDIHKVPDFLRYNHVRWEDSMRGQVDAVHAALAGPLADADVVLTHDLVYQVSELVLNLAARRFAAENPDVRWLHTIHSAGRPELVTSNVPEVQECKERFPNSLLVFPNEYSRRRVAVNMGYEEDQVKCVPHPTDPYEFFGVDPLAKAFCEDAGLLKADVVLVYPLRMDPGKQPGILVEIAHGFRTMGMRPLVVFCDFHSTGPEKAALREQCARRAAELRLSDGEVVFTSQWKHEGGRPFEHGCPRGMVSHLMRLADAFVLPSRSETYSLVAQEAALSGLVMVLNETFPPMRSVYGDHAIYREFGGDIDVFTGLDGRTNTEYQPDRLAYMRDVAMRIRYELEHNDVVCQRNRVRRERNPDAVFEKYLEPLIALAPPRGKAPAKKREEKKERPPKTDTPAQTAGGRQFFVVPGREKKGEDAVPEQQTETGTVEGAGEPDRPFFSVVVPTRDRVLRLRRALLSLSAQSFGDFEAIVVDDASSEAKKASNVAAWMNDPRFRCVELQEHGERVVARRTGMAEARGEWICWLDSDDEYASHYLEAVHRAALDEPGASCFNFGAVVHHRKKDAHGVARYTGTSIRPTFRPRLEGERGHEEFKSGKIGAGSFVFRRALLDDMELLPEARSHVQLHEMATDVHHLYPPGGPTLGNPWGDDWLAFYRITRRYRSVPLNVALYVQHVRQ